MGTWNTIILGNDTAQDVYESFMTKYNDGGIPSEVSKSIREDFQNEFVDHENQYNALFGLALAQWETKSLEPDVLSKVKQVIESDKDLQLWVELDADEKMVTRRSIALKTFLAEISIERQNPKRRHKKRFEFKSIELIKAVSPNGQKEMKIQEEVVNGKYVHTSGLLTWINGGGAGILYYDTPNRNIAAKWNNESTLVIQHDREIKFSKKEGTFFFLGDAGKIIYEETLPSHIDADMVLQGHSFLRNSLSCIAFSFRFVHTFCFTFMRHGPVLSHSS